MRHTVSERRKKWFFLRSMFRAFWEHLDKHNVQRRSKNISRPLFAEALEARVMFSASPAPVEPDPEPDEAPVAQEGQIGEVVDGNAGEGEGGGASANATVALVGGRLEISDTSGDPSSITLRMDGSDLVITDAGGSQRIAIDDITADIIVNGGVGDDTLTLDFSGGDFGRNFVYHGGDGGFDTLAVTGGSFGTVTYRATDATDGVLDFGDFTVTFTGLEPNDLTGSTITDLVVNVDPGNFVAGTVTTTISQDAVTTDTLVSFSHGLESVRFRGLTGTLTINGDNVDGDAVVFSGLGTSFAGNLAIGGGGGVDTVDFNAALSLGANSLSVTAETIQVNANVTTAAGSQTYNGALTLSGATLATGVGSVILGGDVTVAGAAASAISGNLDLGAGAARVFTVNDAAAGAANDLTVSAVVSGAGSSIQKDGAGTLVLSSGNSYSGGTTLNAGFLEAGNNGAFGSGTLTLNGGAVRSTASGAANDRTFANAVVFGGDVTLGDATKSASLNFNGTKTLTGNRILTAQSFVYFNSTALGDGGGGFGITKAGASTLILQAANTYTGNTLVTAGTLQVRHNSGISAGTVTLEGTNSTLELYASVTVTRPLIVSDTGALKTLSLGNGANYNGSITIQESGAQSFVITAPTNQNATVSGQITGTGAAGITHNGSGRLNFYGDSDYTGPTNVLTNREIRAFHSNAFGTGIVNLAGENALVELGDGVTLPNDITVSNDFGKKTIRFASGATSAGLGGTITILETTVGNFVLGAATGQTLTVGGTITGAGGAGVAKTGAGTLVLQGDNDYAGPTRIGINLNNAGVVRAAHNHAFGTGAVSLLGTGTVLELANGVTVGNSLTVADDGDNKILRVQDAASASATWSGSVTINETTANDFNLAANTGQTLTLSNAVGGSGGIQKTGAGTVVLAGNNSYLGGTTIGAAATGGGILRAAHNSALGSGGVLVTGTASYLELGNAVTVANALTISNDGDWKGIRVLAGVGNTAEYSGAITTEETFLGHAQLYTPASTTLRCAS